MQNAHPTPAKDDSEGLAGRAAEGDAGAFSELVAASQQQLYYTVLRVVGHQQDARDLVQKTYLKAWARRAELNDPSRWRSWVFSIGLNLARNHLRDHGRRTFDPIDERTASPVPPADERLDARERREGLRRALEELPPRQREVVSLRIDAELPFRDIAEALGCSVGSARVNFHHGLVKLRALLAPEAS